MPEPLRLNAFVFLNGSKLDDIEMQLTICGANLDDPFSIQIKN
jgi:hypothetical protein